MNILLCSDKFKGSISAKGVCEALLEGLKEVNKDILITSIPMADGGDGSIAILKELIDLKRKILSTVDPLGRPIEGEYYHSDDSAYIELATASGLVLLKDEERNPMHTSTRGTGILIKDAIASGFKNIYLFIGGSATNDGGIGIAHELGFQFLVDTGGQIAPIGGNLIHIDRLNKESAIDLEEVHISIFCDVTNPMFGPNGAARVYAKQKGASPEEIQTLDKGLVNLAKLLEAHSGKKLSEMSGLGAAGAVSACLVALMRAELKDGFQMMSKMTSLEETIRNSDIVITGEGKIDSTSFQGKVVGNVVQLCEKYKKKCGIVAGVIDDIDASGLVYQKSIMDLTNDTQKAMSQPNQFLKAMGKEIANLFCS